jgi:hypothetical protein
MTAGWAVAVLAAGLSAGAAQAGARYGAGEGGARPIFAPFMPLTILPQAPAPLSQSVTAVSQSLTVGLGGSGAAGGGIFGSSGAIALASAPDPGASGIALPDHAGPPRPSRLTGLHGPQAIADPDGAVVPVPVPPALALLALTTAVLALSAARGHPRRDAAR